MKNHIPKITQEERRKNSVKIIRKGIQKSKMIKMERISKATYYRYKNLIRDGRSWQRKRGSGRDKRLTKPNKIKIQLLLKANPFQSGRELARIVHPSVSYQTVHRYLISSGFVSKKPGSHFMISQEDKVARLRFGQSLARSRQWGLFSV